MSMSIERIFFREYNFVFSIFFGKLTGKELSAHVLAINRDYAFIKGIRELTDCRFLTDVSEVDGQEFVSSASTKQGLWGGIWGRGAIVATSGEMYNLAKMYADVASYIREDARAFRSMDEAVRWLELEDFKKYFLPIINKAFGNCNDRNQQLVGSSHKCMQDLRHG